MFDINRYMERFLAALLEAFGERLAYVGLQGSYMRGEATERSDIDPMVVIDGLTRADLDRYRAIVESLECADKACGFLCGLQELRRWNPLESCHVLHATHDLYGELAPLLPAYTREDVRNFIKLSLGNLYHDLCHRYVHRSGERNAQALPGCYKAVFFILQNLCWLRTGVFYATKGELLIHLPAEDRAVLETGIRLSSGASYDFDAAFDLLFGWCGQTLRDLSEGAAC